MYGNSPHTWHKNLSNEEVLDVKSLKLENSEIEIRHSRHYPLGDQIAPLIGFYGKDGAWW